MPKLIDPYWITKIAEEAEANPKAGPVRIERRLSEIGARERWIDEPPSVRTVGRILRKHRNLTDGERAIYRDFHWPEAMVARLLPWEATRTAIDLLRYTRIEHGPWPTIQRVLWHWRLSLVNPDWEIGQRDAYVSRIMAALKPGSIRVSDSADNISFADLAPLAEEDLDWDLTLEPWKTQRPFHRVETKDDPNDDDNQQNSREEG